jgi:hypothetical protein
VPADNSASVTGGASLGDDRDHLSNMNARWGSLVIKNSNFLLQIQKSSGSADPDKHPWLLPDL